MKIPTAVFQLWRSLPISMAATLALNEVVIDVSENSNRVIKPLHAAPPISKQPCPPNALLGHWV
jgi:hypothetical protein